MQNFEGLFNTKNNGNLEGISAMETNTEQEKVITIGILGIVSIVAMAIFSGGK